MHQISRWRVLNQIFSFEAYYLAYQLTTTMQIGGLEEEQLDLEAGNLLGGKLMFWAVQGAF